MTPDALTERLKAVCGTRLQAVLLYGSAVAGDHLGKRSDHNVLVILDRLDLEEMRALAPVVRPWVKAGNLVPLLFTPEGLAAAAAVFPLEIVDIQDNHRVLFGTDVVGPLAVHAANLRLELEHELKGKLMKLRAQYLLVKDQPRRVTELMIRSLSTFLVLCRGALRLYQPEVPVRKLEALAALVRHVPIQTHIFETISQLKVGKKVPRVVPDDLFGEYLRAIESVVEAVDAFLHPRRSQEGEQP